MSLVSGQRVNGTGRSLYVIGDRVSEAEHNLKTAKGLRGVFLEKNWQAARGGGYFSYDFKVDPGRPMTLYCTYWGNDAVGRRFTIAVDNKDIWTQVLELNAPGTFFDVEYLIPHKLTRGRTNVTISFRAPPSSSYAGGIFGCQMLHR